MQKRKKFLVYLFISVLSFIGLLLLIYTFDPTKPIEIAAFGLSPIIPFLALLFFSISGLGAFLLKSKRRGVLIAIASVVFFLLQYLRFNNIFYTLIVLAIVALVEILFWKKN